MSRNMFYVFFEKSDKPTIQKSKRLHKSIYKDSEIHKTK